MKSLKLYTLLIVAIFIIGSCSDDDPVETNTSINLKLSYDGQPIHAFQEVAYPLGFKVFFTKFSMFLSDAKLISSTGEVDLFDVVWVDLLKDVTSTEMAEAGLTIQTNEIPVDNYSELVFNIGVNSDENSMNPSDFPNSSALANAGEYWAGWQSYIFHKLEGRMDFDGSGDFADGLALHIGSDDAFRSGSIRKVISIEEGNTNIIQLEIDILDVLGIDSDYFDIQSTPQIHAEEVLPEVLPLMDNLVSAIN